LIDDYLLKEITMRNLIRTIVLTSIVATPAFAQDTRHHGDDVSQGKAMGMQDEHMSSMHQHMQNMQILMDRLKAEQDPDKRQQLMEEHMAAMQSGMEQMRDSMDMKKGMGMMQEHMSMMQMMMEQMTGHQAEAKKQQQHIHKKR
jgi:hypothetical protein